ncbi:SMI1/KNR4 family protein [Pyxidicoccus sp. 3LFB2]
MAGNEYWNSELEGFIRYFARYADWLPERIKGLPESRISNLEELIGQPLPPEYRAFLKLMGDTPKNALNPFLEYVSFGAQEVERIHALENFIPPRQLVYLWTYDCDAPYDIFLETQGAQRAARSLWQAGWSIDENTGGILPEPLDFVPLGGTLMQYLYKDAFLKLRGPLLPHKALLGDFDGSEPTEEAQNSLIEKFVTVAEKLGFLAVPHAGKKLMFFNRSDAALELFENPGANSFYVRAASDSELKKLSKTLADELGVG